MKRKAMAMLLSVTVLTLCAFGMTGCGTSDSAGDDDNSSDNEAAVYTVTFYDSDGTTVLSTAEVEEGATVEEYTPEKDGFNFLGWYATPQFSHEFDFTAAITEDTSVFAAFASEYVEDTRSFAIMGNGKSAIMAESAWGAVISDAHIMTKEDVADANVYTITVDLEADDEFQFAIDSSWNDQRGFGYLVTTEQDGVEYLANAGGLGDNGANKANIKVLISGNYTFTLTTYPGTDPDNLEDAYDTIEWTHNGE